MGTKERPHSQGKGGQWNAPSDRNVSPHSADGERGANNPRQPVRDPGREDEVMNRKPPQSERNPPKKAGTGGEDESRQGKSQGHEADPPRPRREQGQEVPPYAGEDNG